MLSLQTLVCFVMVRFVSMAVALCAFRRLLFPKCILCVSASSAESGILTSPLVAGEDVPAPFLTRAIGVVRCTAIMERVAGLAASF